MMTVSADVMHRGPARFVKRPEGKRLFSQDSFLIASLAFQEAPPAKREFGK